MQTGAASDAPLGLYRVADLDGKVLFCTNKPLANSRLQQLQGMLRVMGLERFLELVRDLDFSPGATLDFADRYMHPSAVVPEDNVLYSLGGVQRILSTAVMGNRDMLGAALKVRRAD